jgi:uncharacterized protein YxjI
MKKGDKLKLLFKQRLFSWFDSYDVYDEDGRVVFVVKGQLSWGHRQNISDAEGNHLGTVKQKVLALAPKFEVFFGESSAGYIRREFFSLFRPHYYFDFNGWEARGNFFEWDYTIKNSDGSVAATVSKQLFHLTDHYVIDVTDPADALAALMFVIAIDAEKCSRDRN